METMRLPGADTFCSVRGVLTPPTPWSNSEDKRSLMNHRDGKEARQGAWRGEERETEARRNIKTESL